MTADQGGQKNHNGKMIAVLFAYFLIVTTQNYIEYVQIKSLMFVKIVVSRLAIHVFDTFNKK